MEINKFLKALFLFLGAGIFLFFSIAFLNSNLSLTASLNKEKFEIINEEGFGNSLLVDKSNTPLISFIDKNNNLILLKKTNGTWQKEIVANDAFFGARTKLKENENGDIFILYINRDGILKLAKKQKEIWEFEEIKKGAFLYSDLFLDKKDGIYVSFWVPREGIFYGRREENGKWMTELVDGGDVGWWNSLFVDKDGRAHISYFDFKNKDLLYVYFNGSYWAKEVVDFEGDVGRWNSIVSGKNGEIFISYFDATNGNLKIAKKENKGWLIETVDSGNYVGERTNLIFDYLNNTPLISYVGGFDNSFRLAKKVNNIWQILIVEKSFKITSKKIKGEIGGDNSIFIDKERNLHLLWQDLYNRKLKYMRIKQ